MGTKKRAKEAIMLVLQKDAKKICMKKINRYFRKLNTVWFVLLFFLFSRILPLIFGGILDLLDIPEDDFIERDYFNIFRVFSVVVIAPLLETLIFQSLAYRFISRINFFRKHKVWIIIVSALIFGIVHSYSISYMVFGFIVGCVFMYAYILRIGKKPYWTVVAIHLLLNLSAILSRYCFS